MKAAVMRRYGPPEVVTVRDLPDPVDEGAGAWCASARRPSTPGTPGSAGAGSRGASRCRAGWRSGARATPAGARRWVFSGTVESVGPASPAWRSATRWLDDRDRDGCARRARGRHARSGSRRCRRRLARRRGRAPLRRHDRAALPGRRVPAGDHACWSTARPARSGRWRCSWPPGRSRRDRGLRAHNADLVRRLGAQEVVDHTATAVLETTERYDVVMETVGNLDWRLGSTPAGAGRRAGARGRGPRRHRPSPR